MSDLPFTDDQLKEWARQAILSARADIDYMGVGEQFEDEWAHLGRTRPGPGGRRR